MHVWDGSGTGQIHFSAASVHAEVLGHIVENRVVQDGLLERLHDCDLGLLANARLEQMRRSGDEWLLTLADGRTARAAGDRRRRRQFGGAPPGRLRNPRVGLPAPRHRHQRALQPSAPHHRLAALSPTRPAGVPAAGARWQQDWCSIVWSTTPEQPSSHGAG
jgi:2-octaprenylphenol hydroxylase